jgi:hypothetical protein
MNHVCFKDRNGQESISELSLGTSVLFSRPFFVVVLNFYEDLCFKSTYAYVDFLNKERKL